MTKAYWEQTIKEYNDIFNDKKLSNKQIDEIIKKILDSDVIWGCVEKIISNEINKL